MIRFQKKLQSNPGIPMSTGQAQLLPSYAAHLWGHRCSSLDPMEAGELFLHPSHHDRFPGGVKNGKRMALVRRADNSGTEREVVSSQHAVCQSCPSSAGGKAPWWYSTTVLDSFSSHLPFWSYHESHKYTNKNGSTKHISICKARGCVCVCMRERLFQLPSFYKVGQMKWHSSCSPQHMLTDAHKTLMTIVATLQHTGAVPLE